MPRCAEPCPLSFRLIAREQQLWLGVDTNKMLVNSTDIYSWVACYTSF